MPTPAWAASAAWRGAPPRAPAARPCRSSSSTRTACCNRSSAWARVARVNGRPSRSSNWSRRSAKAATCLAKAMWMGCAPSFDQKTLIDPQNPEYGAKVNQFVFTDASNEGRTALIRRFTEQSFGSINFANHGSYCGQSFRVGAGAALELRGTATRQAGLAQRRVRFVHRHGAGTVWQPVPAPGPPTGRGALTPGKHLPLRRGVADPADLVQSGGWQRQPLGGRSSRPPTWRWRWA